MSVRGFEWRIQNTSEKNLITKLLENRGITNKEEADLFINHTHDLEGFNPENIQDLTKGADRIMQAIQKNEHIHIFGDYDADGVCSTAIMIQGLTDLGAKNLTYRLPNRLTEGYSLSMDAVESAIKEKVNLLITCDCGTSNFKEIKNLAEAGIDVIVIDHHTIPEKLPEGIFALINPHREDDTYMFSDLCATGVAYKLMQHMHPNPHKFLGTAAVATIADCMPLQSENRFIVAEGLKILKGDPNPGLQALLTLCDCERQEITPDVIGFKIAPRLNAAGRLGHADEALAIFLAPDIGTAMMKGAQLNTYNEMRKKLVLDATAQAVEMTSKMDRNHIIHASSEEWSAGIVGLIAGRLCERYGKPTIALEVQGNKMTASCRSIPSFNIVDGLKACSKHLLRFGGHAQAAGFTIEKSKWKGFVEDLENYAKNKSGKEPNKHVIEIDTELPLKEATMKTIQMQDMLQPYGQTNPKPSYIIRNMEVTECRKVGETKDHLKLYVKSEGREVGGIGFNLGQFADKAQVGTLIDLVCGLEINEFRGSKKIQFMITDFKIAK